MTQNIGQILTKRAYRDPSVEAIHEAESGRRFTYEALNLRSNQVADAMKRSGIEKGDRVGLLLMNGTEFVESFFGAAKIGAVNVPLNWRLVADELVFILSDSGCTMLIFSPEFGEVVSELRDRGETAVQHWVQVGGEPDSDALDYDEWIGAASATEPTAEAAGGDLLFIMYTSGTTGLPKGVMHSHDTVLWACLTITATTDFRDGDRYLNTLPLFHVGALSPVLASVYGGSSITLMKAFDPTASWEVITSEGITTTLMVPAMLQFMLLTHKPEEHNASTLRWVMSGAAPVAVSLIEAYADLDIEIHQVYGLTESCGPACLITSADALARAGSTGRAFFFTQVRVVDNDGQDCAPDVPGEVIVAGPHIMLGYWKRDDATAETIIDGWLHTGDVATMDADGFVTIVDRVKDMLISGGENVYPAEIEGVLLAHEAINDAGVIGIPSSKWGESPLAVIVRANDGLSAQDVIEHCQGKLAPFKAVKAVEFVEVIPRNASGKILKRELRKLFAYDAPE
ncbi:MAG: long-chain-fatty-acid--CoA ligase [Acidimicrobiales bacterium]